MRLPRVRLRIRTLLVLVALVALGLYGHRIYSEGLENHWLLLKLRHGNVGARRAATKEALLSGGEALFGKVYIIEINGQSVDPKELEAMWLKPRQRVAVLLQDLIQVIGDPDPECRVNALKAVARMASEFGTNAEKTAALRHIMAAARDRDESVRLASIMPMVTLANCDSAAVLNTLKSALADPSIKVRREAIRGLAAIALEELPETQPDVASILIPLLASRENTIVRVEAARGLRYFGRDLYRHPAGSGPDVVPALVAALRDPEVDVRRTAAEILASTSHDPRGKTISAWEKRRDAIIPALRVAMSDENKAVREESALALFRFGIRDSGVIELIEQLVRSPDRPGINFFVRALEEWEVEKKK